MLSNRIITYILKRNTTTLIELEGVVLSKGFTLNELYQALDTVHKDKRIDYKANASGEITYRPAIAKTPKAGTHLAWLRDNYVRMDETNNADHPAFADLNFSFLFLSPEEVKQFKIDQRGGFNAKRAYRG